MKQSPICRWLRPLVWLGAALLAAAAGFAQNPPPDPDPTRFNTVSLTAADSSANEIGEDREFAFRLARTGDLDHPLTVFYVLGGSAMPNLDYTTDSLAAGGEAILPPIGVLRSARFEPGEATVDLKFVTVSDNVTEPDEIVVAELVPTPLAGPGVPGMDYQILPPVQARAVIHDSDGDGEARLVITRPESGARYEPGANFEVEALAVDPAGAILRVEFFAGDLKIGVSEIAFLVAPEPGTPITHGITWENALPGRHELHARATTDAGVVVISSGVAIVVEPDPAEVPLVTVVATDGVATEASATDAAIPPDLGTFEVRRTGAADHGLVVFVALRGTAENGVDYQMLGHEVSIPAGQHAASVVVTALQDDVLEGEESVVLEVIQPPGLPDVPPPYLVGRPAEARVVIREEGVPQPTLLITKPESGSGFAAGADIGIQAVAIDPAGAVTRVEFYADENKIGVSEILFLVPPEPSTPITHEFVWQNVPAGAYQLWAKAQLSAETELVSEKVGIVVGDDRLPVVTVVAVDETADEADPGDATVPPDVGVFEVRRTGETDERLVVFAAYHGSARNGADYAELPSEIVIPAGEAGTRLIVKALPDDAVEGQETVVLQLLQPPVIALAGVRPPYWVGQPGEARVFIRDDDVPPPGARLTIIRPTEGEEFAAPASVPIRLTSFDPDGVFEQVEIHANGTKIGDAMFCAPEAFCAPPSPGNPVLHSFGWDRVPPGEYELVALGRSTSGVEVRSEPVKITVRGEPVASLTINHPEDGAVIADGSRIRVSITGFDPAGFFFDGLKVFANGQEVGEAMYCAPEADCRAPEPGEPTWHTFDWRDVAPGSYELQVAGVSSSGAEVKSAKVRFMVRPGGADASIVIHGPPDGGMFPAPALIHIQATAVDPAGYIPYVEFFANGRRIGESSLIFIREPDPGTPIQHGFPWQNVPAGHYEISVVGKSSTGAEVRSAPVSVVVTGGPHPDGEVVITAPPQGSRFEAPATIEIQALATDADSYIPEVEFYANDRKIGESGFAFLVPPEPGTPVEHQFRWTDVPAGEYLLTAVGLSADGDRFRSAPVKVFVGRVTEIPVVTIEAEVAETAEPDGLTSADGAIRPEHPGVFLLRRTGSADHPLRVFYGVGGSATNGRDYLQLDGDATFAAGEHERRIRVVALPDHQVEGRESVVLELLNAALYNVGEPGRAVVQITDADRPGQPRLVLTRPESGAVFEAGADITVQALAVDPSGYFATVEFTANGELIGTSTINFLVPPEPGTPITHEILWENVAAGEYEVIAHAMTTADVRLSSEPVKILVRPAEPTPFARRELPSHFTPGETFTVAIEVQPPAGTLSQGVEDHPPQGWVVTEISHEGAWDATTGKVKFGPFFDADARVLTYAVTSPVDASHHGEFSGIASADGANWRIGGDQVVSAELRHPADHPEGDFVMTLAEVTAYGAAWKAGEPWPLRPNEIPIEYVTRAGALWRGGEAYEFDPHAGPPPLWWVNVPAEEAPPSDAMADAVPEFRTHHRSAAFAVYRLPLDASRTVSAELHVLPVSGVLSQAVEEPVPAGEVSEISHDGVFDAEARVIRWGPFQDGEARVLSFKLQTDEAFLGGAGRLLGRPGVASFDGGRAVVPRFLRVNTPQEVPEIVHLAADLEGRVQLMVLDDAGTADAVLEVSTDLRTWREIGSFTAEGNGGVGLDSDANETEVRFYRARRRAP